MIQRRTWSFIPGHSSRHLKPGRDVKAKPVQDVKAKPGIKGRDRSNYPYTAQAKDIPFQPMNFYISAGSKLLNMQKHLCVCVCVCVLEYTYIHTGVRTYVHTYRNRYIECSEEQPLFSSSKSTKAT